MLDQCIENVEQYFENVELELFFLSFSPATAAVTRGGGAVGARPAEEAATRQQAAGAAT